jgi:hypothetical protein
MFIIVGIICLVLLKKILYFALILAGLAAVLIFSVITAPAGIPAFIVNKLFAKLRLQKFVPLICLIGFGSILYYNVNLGIFDSFLTFDFAKFIFIPVLFYFIMTHQGRFAKFIGENGLMQFSRKSLDFNYVIVLVSFFMAIISLYSDMIVYEMRIINKYTVYAENTYYFLAISMQIYLLMRINGYISSVSDVMKALDFTEKLNSQRSLAQILGGSMSSKEDIQNIFEFLSAKLISQGSVVELELNSQLWLFRAEWYLSKMSEIKDTLALHEKYTQSEVSKVIQDILGLSEKDAEEYVDLYLGSGGYYEFDDGRYYVPYPHTSSIRACFSCGKAEFSGDELQGEWHCSDICEKTDNLCLELKQKPFDEFMANAATSGLVLMAGGAAWNENQKLFATGGQGHGFAAERGNTKVDRLFGRDARVVGDDNAKGGADRIVNGQEIQTKYHASGARSIGSAFDGQNGDFKYFDSNGRPMAIEVPKDQYEAALKTMQQKIRDGKVPGVTDPNAAGDLVVRGNLTYEQAVNITKFGTVESITYDICEGVVIGVAAGGISFAITATVYYMNTKDSKAALRTAAIQAGKTFGQTTLVFVTTQQLHRLSVVQATLTRIDISNCSTTVKTFLEKGLGVNSTSGVNKALRGTVLTSVVLIAATSGPDFVKMVRGRISKAQFAKNIAVTTSGMAGGTVGAMVGGVVCAPLGPIGAIAGRVGGAIIGGLVTSAVSNKLASKFMEEDKDKMLRIVESQLEYLARTFMLSQDEIDNVAANLGKIIDQKALETIHAARDNRRAMANFFLKPVVVSVVKQRPVLDYELDDVMDAVEELNAGDIGGMVMAA